MHINISHCKLINIKEINKNNQPTQASFLKI